MNEAGPVQHQLNVVDGFVLPAFLRGGAGAPPVRADPQIDGDRNAYNEQAAKAQDDEPPDHPHDKLGYQTPKPIRCGVRARMRLFYFEVPFADLDDSWKAATLFLSIRTEPVSTKAGIGAK